MCVKICPVELHCPFIHPNQVEGLLAKVDADCLNLHGESPVNAEFAVLLSI